MNITAFGPEDELPFTGVLVSADGATVRPIYGDGTFGAHDPELLGQAQRGEFGGPCLETLFVDTGESLYVPWGRTPHRTPYGLVDENGFAVDTSDVPVPWMSEASLAEGRRRRLGHYCHYERDHICGIILNEGVEYGVNGYTSPEQFEEPYRDLGIAVRETVQARDEYVYGKGGEPREGLDPAELHRLARAAESAKEAFCRALGVDNEPWEGPE